MRQLLPGCYPHYYNAFKPQDHHRQLQMLYQQRYWNHCCYHHHHLYYHRHMLSFVIKYLIVSKVIPVCFGSVLLLSLIGQWNSPHFLNQWANKTKHPLLARVFPRLVLVTSSRFEFQLTNYAVCVCCDWQTCLQMGFSSRTIHWKTLHRVLMCIFLKKDTYYLPHLEEDAADPSSKSSLLLLRHLGKRFDYKVSNLSTPNLQWKLYWYFIHHPLLIQ